MLYTMLRARFAIACTISLGILVPTSNAFSIRTSFVRTLPVRIHHYQTSSVRSCFLRSTRSSVVDRLELSDNFNRWRFMQNFLDAEIDAADANQVLYSVLDSFLKSPNRSDKDDEFNSEVVSPRLESPHVRALVEELLMLSTEGERSIPAFQDPDCRPGEEQVLQKLEALLPDPRENEDAFKGSWDIVLELHGREAVKINESKGEPEWKALCTVARVLIYFDFMTQGVPSTRATQ